MQEAAQGQVDGVPSTARFSSDYFEWQTQDAHSKVPADSIVTIIQGTESNQQEEDSLLYVKHDEDGKSARLETLKLSGLSSLTRYPSFCHGRPSHLAAGVRLHVIVSRLSGTQKASSFFQQAVKPLLSRLKLDGSYTVHETESAETITRLARTVFLPQALAGVQQTIILMSGDGGLVDLIRVLSEAPWGSSSTSMLVRPVVCLVPMGTGNGLANSTGLLADSTLGLSNLVRGSPADLPAFCVRFPPGSMYVTDEGRGREPVASTGERADVYGVVVVSWGLHASLVADSDTAEYRRFGVDRFKMAAQELLQPADGSASHSYSGSVILVKADGEEEVVDRPSHMYVLITLASQLEKGFTISPASAPLEKQLRIVHFGPVSPERAGELMALAYQGGKHVNQPEVAYAAVEAVRIRVQELDERWRRVCVDGRIILLPDTALGSETSQDEAIQIRLSQRKFCQLVTQLEDLSSSADRQVREQMLVTPRTYSLSQTPSNGVSLSPEDHPTFRTLRGWSVPPAETRRAAEMLLVHQAGSLKVGEVARYTLTYTPSADRILPTPAQLYVKLRNTAATPLRAAYLHGPYALHVSCRPAAFDPNCKFDQHEADGLPQFEPNLKPGGAWDAVIQVPEHVRTSSAASSTTGVTWIIEISSEIIFSSTASVQYELLVGRDAASIELGAPTMANLPPPGQLRDHVIPGPLKKQQRERPGRVPGVYSESIKLRVDDTTSLWNLPPFPSSTESSSNISTSDSPEGVSSPPQDQPKKKRKKIHFVLLTHGLHSNLGADMLYLKESIDAAAKHAREEARKRKKNPNNADSTENDEDDEEDVIVRGFPGNAVRTERGIQYLGKRLAKYIQLMTYPDQPYLPLKSKNKLRRPQARRMLGDNENQNCRQREYAYQVTSISFVGHSLGGLVQTYAIAYIQKHCPDFFNYIRPVNFVAFASPFLGLSNENPMYVKFALDFGLVGRTGQDLGLAWNAPSKVRSGWEAMIGGLGSDANRTQAQDPGSKPLLRVLPSGAAHEVLKRFRNRTIYSNVVNDGIVPLRTSCLLFLDWRGLERVEKARRENGLVGTVAEWGWAQLTGLNSSARAVARAPGLAEDKAQESSSKTDAQSPRLTSRPASGESSPGLPLAGQYLQTESDPALASPQRLSPTSPPTSPASPGPVNSFFSFFRPQKKNKGQKIYKRSQTLHVETPGKETAPTSKPELTSAPVRKALVRGDSLYDDEDGWYTPPRTTILESAGDVLSPPLPPLEYLIDPSSRPRTIFHDRVYHPDDIPPPPPTRPRTIFRSSSNNISRSASMEHPASPSGAAESSKTPTELPQKGSSGMKVEEKIARAYHRDLTWRKVLVRLEPDAHNNIIVRRMFANAYGWPVVKHFVDTHFGYTASARESDDQESREDRAKPMNEPATDQGEEVMGQHDLPRCQTSPNIIQDNAPSSPSGKKSLEPQSDSPPQMQNSPRLELNEPTPPLERNLSSLSVNSKTSQTDSAKWTDTYLEDDGHDDESAEDDIEHYKKHDGIRASDYLEASTPRLGSSEAQSPVS
ncbi:glycogen synthase kinase mutation revertant [Nannizzia gypsea CBS 118893]|uniref:Glycogen synthase kinase mutation revertant n=1 Tax=Arthroderma gypseum (strain ATCC MYA-4604 / CBS 118893) TaxID=535722 RepID=E4V5Z8_ARTGP|nr:glycogen synthase kinase mutation revertant [Nannizzia gypsea CBS 118893]EFR05523.1 glycogen synthase kinase mutation revertant [Nannizzia gypsea CBS 118893]